MLLSRPGERSAAALGVFSLLLCACDEPLRAEECAALLDRYVSLLAASDRPGTTEAEVLKLQAQAREKAGHDPAFRRCSREVSRSQYECALRADTADRFEQCML
jgi:hypothetical protein